MSAASAKRSALVLALDLGILGDYLLRADGPPALNLSLWAAAGVISVLVLRVRRGGLPAGIAMTLAAAWCLSAAIAWRDAPALRALDVLAAAGLATLAGGAVAGSWVRTAGLADYAAACARTVFSVVAGPAPVLRGSPGLWSSPSWSRPALAVVRGALLALPLLLVFGGLLAAADPVFDKLASDALAFDPGELLGRAVLIAVLSWGSAGYLGRFIDAAPATASPLPFPLPRPRIDLADGAVALGLLNALFLVFVAIQLRYLFGGADLVRVTPGLSYAEYARRGFFELLAAAALVIPLLLLADWGIRRERSSEQWLFRSLALGQLLLVFAILASAFYRLRIYWRTYGLTEPRLYATMVMLWVAFVLAWLGVTVLRGRRERFAFGALAAAVAAAFALNLLNPQAIIVHVNAGRAAAGEEYDVAYLKQLSGDAVPALVSSLPVLPESQRCHVAGLLLERWGQARAGGWRTFNQGDWRARRAVAAVRLQLEAIRCPSRAPAARPRSPVAASPERAGG